MENLPSMAGAWWVVVGFKPSISSSYDLTLTRGTSLPWPFFFLSFFSFVINSFLHLHPFATPSFFLFPIGSSQSFRHLPPQSGKPQFSYIYGVALVGTTAVYTLLNLMSETGIDAYRTASVLGYCLLPMVGLGGIGMGVGIEWVVSFASFHSPTVLFSLHLQTVVSISSRLSLY